MLTDHRVLNNEREININSICRLCLMNGPFLRETCGTKIPYMIQYSLDIKILSEDQLPTHICVKCFRQITNFYTFKKRIERNDRELKKAIRLKSKTKDLINIALEKSDINPLELNEIEKVGTLKCSPISKNIRQLNIQVEEANELAGSENKSTRPVLNNKIQGLSVKPSQFIADIQEHHGSLYFDNNIEPPPLVPLQSDPDINTNRTNSKESKINTLNSENFSLRTMIFQLPPLVPIVPIKLDSQNVKARISSILRKLSCKICRTEFQSFDVLKDHKLNSCKLINHSCSICKKSYTDKKKLILHLKRHKVSKEYLCNVCGKRYSSPSTFKVHFRSHTGERPFKCSLCGKGFVRWAGVKNHMTTHEDFKPYECETCGKHFKVVSNLYRHQRMHTGKYTFSCSFCGKAFFQSDHLKLHIRTYHTKEKPYLCCNCGKGFVSDQRLKRHEMVHSGRKPYPCALCLRAYSNAIDLRNHNLKIHIKSGNRDELKKYSCTTCSLKFRHPCRLKKHMKTHEDLNKNCRACGQSFKCEQALTRHLETPGCKDIINGTGPIQS